jgi:hypothetical protein
MHRLTLCLVFVAVSMWIHLTISAQIVPEKTGSRISREEARAALDFHNRVRSDVGSPPLEWSAKLSEYAQAWADELASSGCKMKHRPHSGKWEQIYGENIYWCSGFKAKIRNRWAWVLPLATCQLPIASCQLTSDN